MMGTKNRLILITLALLVFWSCSSDNNGNPDSDNSKSLTIFFVNDQHGQLDNFAKVKHIVDQEKEKTNVILVCSGDIFSGNPVVDNHPEKGYPMIDVMNKTGFDISVIGNHEFDYGLDVLADRMSEAEFDWVCANVDMRNASISQVLPFEGLEIDGVKVTFLGLIETNGKQNGTIPSTHPWRVQDISFTRPENVVSGYSSLKEDENSDVFIALTHLGHSGYGGTLGDFELASQYPFFDLIIGGHSHHCVDTIINNIPIFQAGSNLRHLGKIELSINNKAISSWKYTSIDLNSYQEFDNNLLSKINEYNNLPELKEVIGYSEIHHNEGKVGCFYADALRNVMGVDVVFQNSGGVRSDLDAGDISKREIYEIDPFNNGTVKYDMTVGEIKNFLVNTRSGFFYSGIIIEQNNADALIKDLIGNVMPDSKELTVGINDYIPAVHDEYFPSSGEIQKLSSAETLIYYLENVNNQVNYPSCEQYFRYR